MCQRFPTRSMGDGAVTAHAETDPIIDREGIVRRCVIQLRRPIPRRAPAEDAPYALVGVLGIDSTGAQR